MVRLAAAAGYAYLWGEAASLAPLNPPTQRRSSLSWGLQAFRSSVLAALLRLLFRRLQQNQETHAWLDRCKSELPAARH